MDKRMKILVSNDDGVYAEGIAVLANTLSQIADVTVVAPDRNKSGASNSLTLDNPLRVKQLDNGYYSVEGTPTDCVHLAVTGMLVEEYDMVVSGINRGANLGDDILYSGTVAAATEGRFLGKPAIAVSLDGESPRHYTTAAEVTKQLVLSLQAEPLPSNTLLNVNVPDIALSELKGFEVTRLGKRHIAEPVIHALDPRGNDIYWIGAAGPQEDCGPGTDFYAVENNKVAITPLHFDLTHYQTFDQVAGWVSNL